MNIRAGRPTTSGLRFNETISQPPRRACVRRLDVNALREPHEVELGTRIPMDCPGCLKGLRCCLTASLPLEERLWYPPMFTLRAVERDGTGDRQLTFGDVSYAEPDVHSSGMVTGSRFPYPIGHLEIPDRWITSPTTPSAAFASPIRPAPRRPPR